MCLKVHFVPVANGVGNAGWTMMTAPKNDIRVASYNVNGVLNPVKRSKIMS